MKTAQIWLAVIGAIVLAIIGRETQHQRELKKAREAQEKARLDALAAQDAAAYARAQEKIAGIDRALAIHRTASVADRVQRAVYEARKRRSERG